MAMFSYRLTDNISFNSSASFGYVGRSMRFPAVPDFSNPVQTTYLGGYSGGNYSTSLGITANVFKGGPISRRERRMK
jgi:hypothetical protein